MQLLTLHTKNKTIYVPTSSIVAFTNSDKDKDYTHVTLTHSFTTIKENPNTLLALLTYLNDNPSIFTVDAKTACPEYLL